MQGFLALSKNLILGKEGPVAVLSLALSLSHCNFAEKSRQGALFKLEIEFNSEPLTVTLNNGSS